MNPTIAKILQHNEIFVREKQYEPYMTTKYPSTGIAIVSCMDTRLTQLLPAALGLKNGDVKMITNAGAYVDSLFSDSIRSLLIAIYKLQVDKIMVIGHTQCGAQKMSGASLLNLMKERGVSEETIASLPLSYEELTDWMDGFSEVGESARDTVAFLQNHPLIPADVDISGYVIDVVTGELTPI